MTVEQMQATPKEAKVEATNARTNDAGAVQSMQGEVHDYYKQNGASAPGEQGGGSEGNSGASLPKLAITGGETREGSRPRGAAGGAER